MQLCFLVLREKIDGAYCYSRHSAFSLRCSTEEEEVEGSRPVPEVWGWGGGLFFISSSTSAPSLCPSSHCRGALASLFHCRSCGRPCEDPTRCRGKQPRPSSVCGRLPLLPDHPPPTLHSFSLTSLLRNSSVLSSPVKVQLLLFLSSSRCGDSACQAGAGW